MRIKIIKCSKYKDANHFWENCGSFEVREPLKGFFNRIEEGERYSHYIIGYKKILLKAFIINLYLYFFNIRLYLYENF